jgi:RNA polymerase sigma factor (TIGR02999 family)
VESEPQGEVTVLLQRWREGSRPAENKLFELVLPGLQKLAHHFMRYERADHSLQATELVDAIYFRLVAAKDRDWHNRKHFFAIAARAMRRYLIDHARAKPAGEIVSIGTLELPAMQNHVETALTVDRFLDELAETHPDWSTLVEMKYFLGLTDEEAASAMGLKLRTMQRMWRDARQWLFVRMESGRAHASG